MDKESQEVSSQQEDIEHELERLRAILEGESKLGLWLGKLGVLVFLGPSLTRSIRAWMGA